MLGSGPGVLPPLQPHTRPLLDVVLFRQPLRILLFDFPNRWDFGLRRTRWGMGEWFARLGCERHLVQAPGIRWSGFRKLFGVRLRGEPDRQLLEPDNLLFRSTRHSTGPG